MAGECLRWHPIARGLDVGRRRTCVTSTSTTATMPRIALTAQNKLRLTLRRADGRAQLGTTEDEDRGHAMTGGPRLLPSSWPTT